MPSNFLEMQTKGNDMIIFLNRNNREIKHKGKKVKFTVNEFKMIELLFINRGNVSVDDMKKYIWGERKNIVNTNNISQLLFKVRKKVKECDINMSFKLTTNNNAILVSKGFYFIVRLDNVFTYALFSILILVFSFVIFFKFF
jgi:hypothetical protein